MLSLEQKNVFDTCMKSEHWILNISLKDHNVATCNTTPHSLNTTNFAGGRAAADKNWTGVILGQKAADDSWSFKVVKQRS